jgi:ribulose kinase
MLTVIYWMAHRAPNEGAREITQGAKEVCNSIGGITI